MAGSNSDDLPQRFREHLIFEQDSPAPLHRKPSLQKSLQPVGFSLGLLGSTGIFRHLPASSQTDGTNIPSRLLIILNGAKPLALARLLDIIITGVFRVPKIDSRVLLILKLVVGTYFLCSLAAEGPCVTSNVSRRSTTEFLEDMMHGNNPSQFTFTVLACGQHPMTAKSCRLPPNPVRSTVTRVILTIPLALHQSQDPTTTNPISLVRSHSELPLRLTETATAPQNIPS